MDQPILTKKTLLNYLILEKPCTTRCTVAATVRPHHLINGTEPHYLVFLRVLESYNYKRLLAKLEDNAYIDFYQYKDLFLTGIIFDNQIKGNFDLPTKGEEVIATFDYRNQFLQATKIELIPRYSLKRVDITEVYPLVKLFKTYFNEKLDNQSGLPEDGRDSIPEL